MGTNSHNASVLKNFSRHARSLSRFLTALKVPATIFGICALVIMALSIWGYLIRIGAQSLALKVIFSYQGLIALVMMTFFITLIALVLICAPSYFMAQIPNCFKENRPPKSIVWVVVSAAALVLIEIYLPSHELNAWRWGAGISFLALTLCVIFFLPSRKESWAFLWCAKFKECKYCSAFEFTMIVLLSGLFVTFSFTTLLKVWVLPQSPGLFATICLFFSPLMGYLPGIIWIGALSSGKTFSESLITSAIGVALVFTFVVTVLPTKFYSTALRNAGVFSIEKIPFQLLKTELVPSLNKVFPSTSSRSEKTENGSDKPKNGIVFDAYIRFHFAGIYLLCTEGYDPDQEMTPTGKDRRPAGNCLPFNEDEIRLILMGPQPNNEPQKMEKS